MATRLQQVGMIAMTSRFPLAVNGSFGPDALATLDQAFDNAWAEIAGNFADDALEMESARNQLVAALLMTADRDGCTDVEKLKTAAIRSMALSYFRLRPH